jgi:hypothetical protein
MNQEIWQNWIDNIQWILDISKKRKWDTDELVIKKPVKLQKIESIEKQIGVLYPDDFK